MPWRMQRMLQMQLTPAQLTANKSRQGLFYQTTAPTSGMRTNDLWVDGVNIYRYNGSSWVLASKYDNTITEINGGLITTGAIAFGSTGGMAASGTIRIWSGGTAGANGQPPTSPTFTVDSSGNVISNGTITANNAISLRNGQAGIIGYGTSNSSIRFWAGGSVPESADFRVDQSGDVNVKMLNAINITCGSSDFSSIYLTDKSWSNNYVRLFAAREAKGIEIQKTYQGILDNVGGFIVMKYNPDATAYREIGFFVRHFKSDASWIFRTCIKASQLPSLVQVNDLDASGTKYNVK